MREALLNHRLATAWHEGKERWARMDMCGLEVGLTSLNTYKARCVVAVMCCVGLCTGLGCLWHAEPVLPHELLVCPAAVPA